MIHILFGADSFGRREALEELRRSLDHDGSLETNTLWLSAREAKPEEVVAACGAAPFLGGLRMVVLEGLLRLAQEGPVRGRRAGAAQQAASDWRPLLEFAAEMPETTALVIVDGAASPSNPLLAALQTNATVREFRPPANLVEWVQERARKMSLRLDARAARTLVQMVGGQEPRAGGEYLDTWCLAAELDKLASYSHGDAVKEADVQALSPVLRDQKGYFLCDAIVEGRSAAAAKLLYELLEQQEPGQVILSTIAGRYRRLAIARDMHDRGESGEAIGRELSAKGYGLDKLIEQSGRFSLAELRAAYARIVAADFTQKSGISSEAHELDTLVQDLATGAPATAR
jgi:DNA polymerase III delta subunit